MKNSSLKNLRKRTQVLFSYDNDRSGNGLKNGMPSGDPTVTTIIQATTSSILHLK